MARGTSNTKTPREQLTEAFADSDVLDALEASTELSRAELVDYLGVLSKPPEPTLDVDGLPEPREGFGFIVIEAELDVVGAYAALHPAERETMAAQGAGKLKQALWEMGRMRGGNIDAEAEPASVAILVKP